MGNFLLGDPVFTMRRWRWWYGGGGVVWAYLHWRPAQSSQLVLAWPTQYEDIKHSFSFGDQDLQHPHYYHNTHTGHQTGWWMEKYKNSVADIELPNVRKWNSVLVLKDDQEVINLYIYLESLKVYPIEQRISLNSVWLGEDLLLQKKNEIH